MCVCVCVYIYIFICIYCVCVRYNRNLCCYNLFTHIAYSFFSTYNCIQPGDSLVSRNM